MLLFQSRSSRSVRETVGGEMVLGLRMFNFLHLFYPVPVPVRVITVGLASQK